MINHHGIKNPMYGKHHSDKTKEKLSRIMKEIKSGERNPMFGKHLSDETKKKISQANKGKIRTTEYKKRMSIFHSLRKRKPHDERTKLKISKSLFGHKTPYNIRLKISQNGKGKKHIITAPLFNQREKNNFYGRHHSAISINKMRETWRTNSQKNIEHIFRAVGAKPNKKEILLYEILNSAYPNEYEYTGDGKLVIEGLVPDYANINGRKELIELFGDYWHRNDNPEDKITHYKKYGFECLVIWEHELTNTLKLIEKIRIFRKDDSSAVNRYYKW